MATGTNGEDEQPATRLFGYSFAVLVLGLVGILVGVVLIDSVPPTLGGGLIVAGYVLLYAGVLASLYLDLRGARTVRNERPLDGESG